MAKYKRQKVKRYHRSFYSRGAGDIVLDPFAGSGTTLAACEQSGRTAYVAELDPGYAAGIADRWRRLAGEEAAAA